MGKTEIKAKLEKIIHEDHNLITTIEAQKAVIKIIGLLDEYAQQVSQEADDILGSILHALDAGCEIGVNSPLHKRISKHFKTNSNVERNL